MSDGMIEGLKFKVTSQELTGMCMKTAKYHEEKAEFYEKAAKVSREAEIDVTEGRSHYHSGGNPADRMEEKARSHRNQIKEFEFMAKHVVAGGTYLLDRHDLASFH